MALRSYVLCSLEAGLDRDAVARLVAALEELSEVTFAEPVVGKYDLLVSVEGDSAIEELIEQMKHIQGVCALEPLKVNPIPARSRMHRNLSGIPTARA